MLKSVIIDDEMAARKSLEKIIQLYLHDWVVVEGLAENLKAGIQLIRKTKPDIVFLDIEMPAQNGLELFDYIDTNFNVIVITAYKDYAIEALRNGASDYLLKPVNVGDLKKAIERIIESKKQASNKNQESPAPETGKLLLPCPKGFLVMNQEEILAIHAEGNQSVVYKTNGETILINKGLGSFEECLPAGRFFRTHRSAIVNTQFVTEINKDKCTVMVNHKVRLPLSVGNIKPLIETLKAILDVDTH
jgi:two-component system, LytTR family, response regulator